MNARATLDPATLLAGLLERRLDEGPWGWLAERVAEIAAGVDGTRFAGLISLANRFVPAGPLAPDPADLDRARELPGGGLAGWNPERWSLLEAARARLVLARPDLADESFGRDLEDAFRYADQGELCALYKTLCLLPAPERFRWRAAEGCRTNIVPVFESIACDNPYPAALFDDVAWQQLVIKALFIGAPLWRVQGLDGRLGPELARMALDLADERRSAGRAVPPELWLCLGTHGGERGLAALELELATSDTLRRRAALLGLARAGQSDRLTEFLGALPDGADELAQTAQTALAGRTDQEAFRDLHPTSN